MENCEEFVAIRASRVQSFRMVNSRTINFKMLNLTKNLAKKFYSSIKYEPNTYVVNFEHINYT